MSERDQHIIRLLSEYLSGEMTDSHRAELMLWLEEKESNRQFFDRFCEDRSFRCRWELRQSINTDAAISVFDQRTRKASGMHHWKKRLIYTGVAAMLMLALGVSLWRYIRVPVDEPGVTPAVIQPGSSKATLILSDGQTMNLMEKDSISVRLGSGTQFTNKDNRLVYHGEQTETLQYNELQIPRGGEYRVILADGTAVRLNSGSSLKYPVAFGKEKREVILTGEAYFEVEKSTVPFLVRVGDLTVKVYGTSFNINTHIENRIQTALFEGKVGITVNGAEKEYMLAPSQLADFNVQSGDMDICERDLSPYLAWTKGLFIFNNKSLAEIMTTLSLWYDMDVFYQNPALQELHFTGCLKRYDDIGQILRPLSQSVGVKFSQQGKTLTISY